MLMRLSRVIYFSGGEAMVALASRLRQVFRRLGRAPLFTALTLITLAVGIGATTLIFSVVDGILLKPLPYPHPEQLIGVWYTTPKVDIKDLNMSPSFYFIAREQNKTLEAIGAYQGYSMSITGKGQPEQVTGLDVTHEVLPILGVKPALGRLFSEADDQPGAPATVILSHAFWQKKFGGSRSVIGQTITADGKPREIIGVLPKDFHFLNWDDRALWLPMGWDRSKTKLGNFSYEGLARMKPGVTIQQVSADLQRLIPAPAPPVPRPVCCARDAARDSGSTCVHPRAGPRSPDLRRTSPRESARSAAPRLWPVPAQIAAPEG